MVLGMMSWTPAPDQPHLLAWWQPLMAFTRRARNDDVPWLLFVDEFQLVRRVDRPGRPSVWVYVHERGSEELLVDESGTAYKFIVHRRGNSRGRFAPIDSNTAVWRAELPYVMERGIVEDRPPWRFDDIGPDPPYPPYLPDPPDGPAPSPARRTRRRHGDRGDHLRLVGTPSEAG